MSFRKSQLYIAFRRKREGRKRSAFSPLRFGISLENGGNPASITHTDSSYTEQILGASVFKFCAQSATGHPELAEQYRKRFPVLRHLGLRVQ